MSFDFTVRTMRDLADAVQRFGFLPLFKNSVPGFSVEEHAAPAAWFGGGEGVWEWKGPVIRETSCAYGKLFEKKAAFVSREWFPELANYRRDGYDFDARCDDGLAPTRERELYELLEANAPILSKELKRLGGYGKHGRRGFDGTMTRLQEQCYVLTSDFVYSTDRHGNTYGWGVAEYTTPERLFGADFCREAYRREPAESHARILAHLRGLLPEASEDALRRLLR